MWGKSTAIGRDRHDGYSTPFKIGNVEVVEDDGSLQVYRAACHADLGGLVNGERGLW